MRQVAMPTGEDMEAAHEILSIINAVSRGDLTYAMGAYIGDGLPVELDPDNPLHLRVLYDKLKACIDKSPAGLHRLVWGFDMLIQADILDATSTTVELHPRITRALGRMPMFDTLILANILDATSTTVELHPRVTRVLMHMAMVDKTNAAVKYFRAHPGITFHQAMEAVEALPEEKKHV